MKASISSTSHYAPEKTLTNQDLEKIIDTTDEWIKTRTGIEKRHIIGENEATSDMATNIALDLLKKSKLDAKQIELIIVCTVTPDHFAPSTAALVQNNIGASKAWGYDLSAACTGFLYGLETGAKFIESGKYNNAMIIGLDSMSTIMDYQDRNVCVLFGDGGGGAILEKSNRYGIIDSLLRMDGSGGKFLIVPGGGSRMPTTSKTIENREHFLKQDGKTIFKFAVKGMADVSEEILRKNNLSGDDIDLFIPHQANKRIIDAAAKRCGISQDKVVININEYGNTTAGTIPIAINESVISGRLCKGDILLLAAFGAGFTWGSMIIRWGN
tara:strand:+ start:851 stop:1831 length:981 start_codon:yes stop_codon:yes gene_type:complete